GRDRALLLSRPQWGSSRRPAGPRSWRGPAGQSRRVLVVGVHAGIRGPAARPGRGTRVDHARVRTRRGPSELRVRGGALAEPLLANVGLADALSRAGPRDQR